MRGNTAEVSVQRGSIAAYGYFDRGGTAVTNIFVKLRFGPKPVHFMKDSTVNQPMIEGVNSTSAFVRDEIAAGAGVSDLHAQIIALEELRYKAMLAANTAKLDALFAPDLHYMHSDASVDNKASYLGKISSSQIRYLDIDTNGIEVRVHGDRALVLGHLRANIVSAGEPRTLNCKYIGVWQRQDAVWRFEAFAPTPIPPGR